MLQDVNMTTEELGIFKHLLDVEILLDSRYSRFNGARRNKRCTRTLKNLAALHRHMPGTDQTYQQMFREYAQGIEDEAAFWSSSS